MDVRGTDSKEVRGAEGTEGRAFLGGAALPALRSAVSFQPGLQPLRYAASLFGKPFSWLTHRSEKPSPAAITAPQLPRIPPPYRDPRKRRSKSHISPAPPTSLLAFSQPSASLPPAPCRTC